VLSCQTARALGWLYSDKAHSFHREGGRVATTLGRLERFSQQLTADAVTAVFELAQSLSATNRTECSPDGFKQRLVRADFYLA
jgi:hypothetical protein